MLLSINELFPTIATTPTANYFGEKKDAQEFHGLPSDVKNLIESSLTAIGLGNVDESDFDKAATNTLGIKRSSFLDDDLDSFERSTTPATNNTSTGSANPMSRPMNIPNSFSNDYFSQSSSAKSPFDAPNHLFDGPIESVC